MGKIDEPKIRVTRLRSSTNVFVLLLTGFMLGGCGYSDKEPSYLVETGRPNVFRMEVIQPWGFLPIDRERVKAVMVYEPNEFISSWDKVKVYWRIVTEKPVDAEKFEVTVGVIPNGFIQEIPPSGQMFVPTSGKKYEIAVKIAHVGGMPWIETPWVAK